MIDFENDHDYSIDDIKSDVYYITAEWERGRRYLLFALIDEKNKGIQLFWNNTGYPHLNDGKWKEWFSEEEFKVPSWIKYLLPYEVVNEKSWGCNIDENKFDEVKQKILEIYDGIRRYKDNEYVTYYFIRILPKDYR